MKNEIRVRDERNEEGTGFVEIEEKVGNHWMVITHHWYYKGENKSLSIHSDIVSTVNILQFTNGKSKWSKKTIENSKKVAMNYNYTQLKRTIEE